MIKLIVICYKLISVPAIILIIAIHSLIKAAVSTALGDDLPKKGARLSLNPFSHVDAIGLLLFFFTGYGWDKPVRTSAMKYKNKKRDTILVNILPMAVCLLVSFAAIFARYHFFNTYNSMPMQFVTAFLNQLSIYGINMAVFNIIPIYPMDASSILKSFLSPNQVVSFSRYEGVLQIILVFAIMLGFLNVILDPVSNFIYSLFIVFGG